MREKKKRKVNSFAMAFIIAIAVVVILALAGGLSYSWYRNEVDGNGRKDAEAVITVEQGMTPTQIAKLLEENGIIKSAQVFRFYLKNAGGAEKLQYGDFDLNSQMSYDDIIAELQTMKNRRDTVRVTFPEGSTVIQFANKMADAGLCTAEEFIDVANNGDFSQFKFWAEIGDTPNRFMKAEGYLMPETYEFFKDDSVYNMVEKLYAHFEESFTDEMYTRMHELGFTLDKLVTLASFVQEEAGHDSEQPKVAAVLHNRISPDSVLPRLECNVCSLIMEPGNYVNDYIIPYYGGEANVPAGMLAAYDTYKIKGLPAGPISCPGKIALKNTLYPEENFDYMFFVTDLTGKYYYSKTYAEHLVNVDKAWAVNASLNKK